jgi:23S rRNA pseudouridine1911/1915/1917 synthase
VVWGWPEWDLHQVDAPLARLGQHGPSAIWLKQGIHPLGLEARTEFRVEQRFQKATANGDRFSIIRAIPLTGRTHQIRVHLAHAGYPVVGDKIYGPDEQLYLRFIQTGWTKELEQRLLLPRHALHSAKLTIPGENEWSSELPADLAAFVGR